MVRMIWRCFVGGRQNHQTPYWKRLETCQILFTMILERCPTSWIFPIDDKSSDQVVDNNLRLRVFHEYSVVADLAWVDWFLGISSSLVEYYCHQWSGNMLFFWRKLYNSISLNTKKLLSYFVHQYLII